MAVVSRTRGGDRELLETTSGKMNYLGRTGVDEKKKKSELCHYLKRGPLTALQGTPQKQGTGFGEFSLRSKRTGRLLSSVYFLAVGSSSVREGSCTREGGHET